MGELGYGTRGPLVSKLKQLTSDIQSIYEAFLDAQTLYQQGKIGEKEFFSKMGDFVKSFASLGFLTVKVILELDAAIGKEARKPEEVTRPAPSISPEELQVREPRPKVEVTVGKFCALCGARIPMGAKFCTSCGRPQT